MKDFLCKLKELKAYREKYGGLVKTEEYLS
jgi:hypothetical protein